MYEFLSLDVFENILLRLDDVKDLIRCKSVCKSWHSFISSPRFANSHLNNSYKNQCNNHQLGDTRITIHTAIDALSEDQSEILRGFFLPFSKKIKILSGFYIVGSSNGLVCISPCRAHLLVTNPCTSELRTLPTPPYPPSVVAEDDSPRSALCWGFGYDSSINDYKVMVGFKKSKHRTIFYILTLGTNIWRPIMHINYRRAASKTAILFNGSLYWFMINKKTKKKVILSFHLSWEKFREIPEPNHVLYESNNQDYRLGILEQRLCIFHRVLYQHPSLCNKWVMKNVNHWEFIPCDYEMKYDTVHRLKMMGNVFHDFYIENTPCSFCLDGQTLTTTGDYILNHIFVQSLVSPHVNVHTQTPYTMKPKEGNEIDETTNTEGKIRKRKTCTVTK